MQTCTACDERKENQHFYKRTNGKLHKRCKTCYIKRYGDKRSHDAAHTPFKIGSSPDAGCNHYHCKAPYLYCLNKEVIHQTVHDSILIGCNPEKSTKNGTCGIIEY